MGAITLAIFAHYQTKTRILIDDTLYRSTHHLMTDILPKMGIKSDQLDFHELNALEKQLQAENYSVLYFESPTNPTMRCYDIKAIYDLAHEHGVKVVFDNTFATPLCQHPLKLGVDLEVHSATKYFRDGDAMEMQWAE